ncbi:class I SAM-dependent methyltransferase [Brasilonema sp. UFV-L1]|uniref:class I SAM-dependent methyltransferase n=1 Tax=Brasilonema sp. UFV-L1 TaxID=2234130 RepID=UPI00145D8844|nr:class I SAM-dependent methyltransferase [Brasilonema sp. UFV-L1]NMG05563.1 class I SAM-dependent methyltransferase [Brasilonema sp. UFV-L1]
MSELNNYQSEGQVFERDWSAYYNAVVGRPPRDTLLKALGYFDIESLNRNETSVLYSRFAVDLGCGEGRDTVELLRRGWRVLAMDGEAEAIARLLERPDINRQLLETRVVAFQDVMLPESVDLVNASFSLPFCSPESFPSLWEKIISSLRSGGRFCRQLFGNHDSWAIYASMNHHTRQQVEMLLQPFEIEILQEEDHPGKTPIGEEKHWHIFHIVARKK